MAAELTFEDARTRGLQWTMTAYLVALTLAAVPFFEALYLERARGYGTRRPRRPARGSRATVLQAVHDPAASGTAWALDGVAFAAAAGALVCLVFPRT
jgi:hypothetical protein